MRRKVFPTLSMKNEEVIITNIGLFRLVFLLFVIFSLWPRKETIKTIVADKDLG